MHAPVLVCLSTPLSLPLYLFLPFFLFSPLSLCLFFVGHLSFSLLLSVAPFLSSPLPPSLSCPPFFFSFFLSLPRSLSLSRLLSLPAAHFHSRLPSLSFSILLHLCVCLVCEGVHTRAKCVFGSGQNVPAVSLGLRIYACLYVSLYLSVSIFARLSSFIDIRNQLYFLYRPQPLSVMSR